MTGGEPYFLTTAIDYVNNLPHIGTAYEKIGADVIARFKRMQGHSVFFLMGNDEHSINVKKEALSRGLDPHAYCDEMAGRFRAIWDKLDISFDEFIRTTEDRHRRAVTALFQKIYENGDIYPGTYKGLYCDSCETFYRDKDLVSGRCPHHGTEPHPIEEENYFFALSRYADRIEKLILNKTLRILPEIRENEILNVLRGGLEDISISRSSFDWGIPLPIQPGHVVYVWFDALINYISAVGYGSNVEKFARSWPADMHIIGKDITRFHCIIWPAMLLSAGLALPRVVFGHGFVFLKGEKMSKTLGNVVTPMELIDAYGPDALRYYLLRDTSYGKDGNFTWENFLERYNGDLANDLGNLLQRALTMLHRYESGTIPLPNDLLAGDRAVQEDCLALPGDVGVFLDPRRGDIDFHLALSRIWDTVRRANQYIDRSAPWDLHKKGETLRLSTVLYCTLECLRFIGTILFPFLPRTAREILRQLGQPDAQHPMVLASLSQWGGLAPSTTVPKPSALFPRIDTREGPKPEKPPVPPPTRKPSSKKLPEIPLETFQSLELRAGTILEAERIEDTEKLLKLTVDIGEKRTIVAGIGRSFSPEDLQGQQVVVIANLKPTRIRGVLSEGMVLAAGRETELALVTLSQQVPPGEKIK
jgi:methionyl-tRNA synthetase